MQHVLELDLVRLVTDLDLDHDRTFTLRFDTRGVSDFDFLE